MLCFRSVNLSSDDLACPAVSSLVCRGVWVGALVALLVIFRSQSDGECSTVALRFFIAALLFTALGAMVDIYLAVFSSKGTMANSKPRNGVPAWFTVRILAAIVELSIACLIEVFLFASGVSEKSAESPLGLIGPLSALLSSSTFPHPLF